MANGIVASRRLDFNENALDGKKVPTKKVLVEEIATELYWEFGRVARNFTSDYRVLYLLPGYLPNIDAFFGRRERQKTGKFELASSFS